MDWDVRYCSPSAKTKAFAVVLQDWSSLKFDSAGDVITAALLRKAGRKPYFSVGGNRRADQGHHRREVHCRGQVSHLTFVAGGPAY